MGTEDAANVEESNQISELEQKVIRQIEYYFGNFNLVKDKFLREQLKLDDGWVPLDVLISFNRLKSITGDFDVICKALKKSPSQLMEVDEEAKKIRRRVEKPLPETDDTSRDLLDDRTLYVKGFKKTTTLDELLEFFKEHKAEHINMRRHKLQKNKPFKGSCFIMFETKEDADKFLANKEIKYENTELLKETRKDYIKRKDIFYENLKAEKGKKEAEKGNKKASNEEGKDNEKGKDNENKEDITVIPGCLLKICGLGKDCSREDIKEVFEKYGPVVYVDYSRGKTEAVLRFETGIAASVLEGITEEDGEKKIEILSEKTTLSLIEGESEIEYWKNIAINKATHRRLFNQRPGRGRFNKGNRNWGRGKRNHRDGDSGDQRPYKKQKVDSNEQQNDKPNEEANGVKKEPKVEPE